MAALTYVEVTDGGWWCCINCRSELLMVQNMGAGVDPAYFCVECEPSEILQAIQAQGA